jgi:hypothetical protein
MAPLMFCDHSDLASRLHTRLPVAGFVRSERLAETPASPATRNAMSGRGVPVMDKD